MAQLTGRNRRRSVRKAFELRAMLELGGSCSLARIVTVSRDGLGLTTDIHTLPRRFDQVSLRFKTEDGDLIVHGDVRWSAPKAGTASAFGVELRAPTPDYAGFYDALPA